MTTAPRPDVMVDGMQQIPGPQPILAAQRRGYYLTAGVLLVIGRSLFHVCRKTAHKIKTPFQTVRADFPHTASLEIHIARLEASAGRRERGRFQRSRPRVAMSASPCTSDHAGRLLECFLAHHRAIRCSTKRSSFDSVRRRIRRKYSRAPRM